MYYYQVTKYNPIYRNEKGWYTKDEWTDFSCVGQEFEGKLCTLKDYEYIEYLYIKAVLAFMDCMKIDYLICSKLEKRSKSLHAKEVSSELRALYERTYLGMKVSKNEILIFLKLVLRRYLWCELIHNENKMFVSFSYDYYMDIGVEKECKEVVEQINQSGLFVEESVSSYLNQDVDEDDG